jgi:hypothetical protein
MLVIGVCAVPAFGSSINLGSAGSFGMLGGTISNTGTSVVQGNVGATITITGFPPGTATGTVYTSPNSPATTVGMAYTDFETAFTTAAGDGSTQTPAGLATSEVFLGGGVYAFPNIPTTTSTAAITLTFDAQGNGNAVFIMQFPGALAIDGPITFNLANGALASNIYWIIGSPANAEAMTISPTNVPGNQMVWDGSILAGTFTMADNSGALSGTINGCVLTVNANTLANTTNINGCSATGTSTPEPGSAGLCALGCLLGALGLRKFRSA